MGRKNEQAELLKRRRVEARSVRYGQCHPFRRCDLRIAAVLCLLLFASYSPAAHVLGQQNSTWPKSITVDVDKPLTQLLQHHSIGKTPQSETEIKFRGDGTVWRFIQFDYLTEKVGIKVNGTLLGYRESEPLLPKRWYSFRDTLSVFLEIKPDAQVPVEVLVSYGTPELQSGQEFLRDQTLKAEDVRKFPINNSVKPTATQSLRFSWDAPVANPALGSPSPPASPTPTPTPESSWWKYLTEEDQPFGLFVLFFAVCFLALLGVLARPYLKRRLADRRHRRRKEAEAERRFQSQNQPPKQKPPPIKQKPEQSQKQAAVRTKPATDAEMYDFGGATAQQAEPVATANHQGPDEGGQTSSSNPTSQNDYDWPQAEKHEPSPRTPMQSVPLVGQDGKKWLELEGKMNQLEMTLSQKVDRQENLTPTARANVGSMIGQSETNARAHMESRLKQSATEAVEPLEQLVNGQASFVKEEFEKTASRITQVSGEGEKVRKQLGEVISELRKVEERLQTRLVELQTAVDRRTVPDSFYARTLGTVLGQHIEALQDGNFEKLLGEQLNHFFQTDVARGEGLQELRQRAERINVALKDVSVQMEKLNPQATGEARPQIQRVETLVTDLIGLQAQLQTRRATVETTLHIPVSTHPGARQTFLEELGRGIRREIDKLKEPENYFDSELERLITADLIAVVDICDKKIASAPGNRPELEPALKKLFEEAGLRSILPNRGDQFNTAEQDLIEMDQSGGGQTLTVAQVVTRGFHYKHGDKESLLRKAGVKVYK